MGGGSGIYNSRNYNGIIALLADALVLFGIYNSRNYNGIIALSSKPF